MRRGDRRAAPGDRRPPGAGSGWRWRPLAALVVSAALTAAACTGTAGTAGIPRGTAPSPPDPLPRDLAEVACSLPREQLLRIWRGVQPDRAGEIQIAVTRVASGDEGAEGTTWALAPQVARLFRLPGYVNDLPPLSAYVGRVDAVDGLLDGTWRGLDFLDERVRYGFDTPARIPFRTRLVEEVVRREEFGRDEVPDLLFVNYKALDQVGHLFSLNSREMRDTVRVQDQDLRELVRFLDRQVGRGRWVLALTADHGTQYDPEVSGAFRISVPRLRENLNVAFGREGGPPIVEQIRPTEIWLNTRELSRNGASLEDVAGYLMEYTKARAAGPTTPVGPRERRDRVFAAAFPTAILPSLPCLP